MFRFLITLALFCAPLMTLSASQPEGAAQQSPIDYHLASGEFAPFTGEQLPNGGIATDIVQRVISSMNKNAEITYLPWRRGHLKTLQGDFLAIYPYSVSEERKKIWHYSGVLYELEEIIFSKTSRRFTYQGHDDLKGLSICKPVGYNLFDLKKLRDDGLISIEQPSDLKSCFLMLNAGHVDLVVTNPNTAWNMIKTLQLNTSDFTQTPTPLKQVTHHLIAPKANPDAERFIKYFNKQLQTLKDAGIINEVLKGHL